MPRRLGKAATEAARAQSPALLPADFSHQIHARVESRDIGSLHGQALRDYALRQGISRRDVENLTEDRLRQNVKLQVIENYELLES